MVVVVLVCVNHFGRFGGLKRLFTLLLTLLIAKKLILNGHAPAFAVIA